MTLQASSQTAPDRSLPTRAARPSPRRLALIGTYPPTQCGIATYTQALRGALLQSGREIAHADVVRMLQPGDSEGSDPAVMAEIDVSRPGAVSAVASRLASHDVALVQHEFGIYGANDGAEVAALVESTEIPVIVTLHTVVASPTPIQREIVRRLLRSAEAVVVHSDIGRRLLVREHGMTGTKVVTIPHGAHARLRADSGSRRAALRPPVLLTWGLIGPGKGLEWAVEAMAILTRRRPGIRYIIAGGTHPKVRTSEGDAYLELIRKRIERFGLTGTIELVDHYLSDDELAGLLGKATAVVLPYDSTEQTSSGVLTEAAFAGIPVVATAFPHAVELAERGAALTVPHRDAAALADAVDGLLADPDRVAAMSAAQRRWATRYSWRAVGQRYLELIRTRLGTTFQRA